MAFEYLFICFFVCFQFSTSFGSQEDKKLPGARARKENQIGLRDCYTKQNYKSSQNSSRGGKFSLFGSFSVSS